jgi:hypothetical protein
MNLPFLEVLQWKCHTKDFVLYHRKKLARLSNRRPDELAAKSLKTSSTNFIHEALTLQDSEV